MPYTSCAHYDRVGAPAQGCNDSKMRTLSAFSVRTGPRDYCTIYYEKNCGGISAKYVVDKCSNIRDTKDKLREIKSFRCEYFQ